MNMFGFKTTLLVLMIIEIHKIKSVPYSYQPNIADDCDVKGSTGCDTSHCCVYQGQIFRNLNSTLKIKQTCMPMRKAGEFCLAKPEHFLCDCQDGLFCKTTEKDNFGHCELME